MTFKKSWLSYGLWAFYVIFAFVFQVGAILAVMEYAPKLNEYVKIGVVCLSFILAIGLFFLIRKAVEESWKDTTESGMKRAFIIETIFVAVVFVAGIVLRVLFIKNNGAEAAYFEWASVNGQPLTALTHGAQNIYVGLLRCLFLVVGNRFMAGIVLQIVLQVLMVLVWYLAIRKMAGQIAAFVLLAGVMLLPQSIRMGLTYSPKILYLLLFGIILLMMNAFWKRFYAQTELKWYSWVQTAALGVGIGYMTYLDITGLVLIVLLLFALAVHPAPTEEPYPLLHKLLQILLAMITCVVSLIGFFFVEALQSGTSLISVADNWFGLFVCKGIPGLEGISGMLGFDLTNSITAVFAATIMFMASLAFWVHKKNEMQMPWFVVTIILAVLYVCNFCAESMQCDYMLVLMILLMAGVGVRAVFMEKEMDNTIREKREKKAKVMTEITAPVVAAATIEAETTTVQEVREKKINYIENPLPLPKKHTKRTMGYRIDVPPEAMKYDIDISDMDDFDLK